MKPFARGWARTLITVWLAGLALMGLGVAATVGLSHWTLADAERWEERWHRLPTWVLWTPDRRTPASSGGTLGMLQIRSEELEAHALPTSGPVISIARLPGGIAAASFDDGAWLISDRGLESLPFGVQVNALASDERGVLYAATSEGAFQRSVHGVTTRLHPAPMTAVAMWRGQPWFTSPGGVFTVDAQGVVRLGDERGLSPVRPSSVADCGAMLCIGAEDGLWLFDGSKAVRRTSAASELTSDSVTSVAFGEGNVWVGTFDAGLNRLTSTGTRRISPADGLNDGRIEPRALTVSHGLAVAGTPSGLLVLFREKSGQVRAEPSSREVTAVTPDERGFWVGSRGRVQLLSLRVP